MSKSISIIASLLCVFASSSALADDMVRVPSEGAQATGYTGCSIDDSACKASTVKSSKIDAFYIDAKPVTNAEAQVCIQAGQCPKEYHTVDAIDDISQSERPAFVSYEFAEKYCASVGKELPTEKQWLAAAMQDGVHKYVWGDEPYITATAQIAIDDYKSLVDAGSMPSDQTHGIYDMSGNGYEWINAPVHKGYVAPDVACVATSSRECIGGAPLPLYQKIGIYESSSATFRCVKNAD